MGQNLAWCYEYRISLSYLGRFASKAWQTGFLRRFSQKVTRIYRCYEDCDFCEEFEEAWHLTNIIYGAVREDLLP